MSLDRQGALDATAALVAPLVSEVVLGVPNDLGARLSAYLGLVQGETGDRTASGGSHVFQHVRVRVTLGYRTDGDVTTAERELADALDNLARAFYAARNAGQFAALGPVTLDPTPGAAVEYALIAGREWRLIPVDVVFDQQEVLG